MDTIYSSINLVSLVAAEAVCERSSLSIEAALQWESPVLNQVNFSNGDKMHVVKLIDEPGSFRIYYHGCIPVELNESGLVYPFKKGQMKELPQLKERVERAMDSNAQKMYIPRDDPVSETKDEPMPEESATASDDKPIPPSMKPPGFEDEYEIMGQKRKPIPLDPPAIGDRDLNPPGLPKYPEMKPFVDPLRKPTGEAGMHPTADHPLFRNPLRYDPPSVPPGARYDQPFFGGNTDPDMVGAGLPGDLGSLGRKFQKPGFGGSGSGGSGLGGLGGSGSGGSGLGGLGGPGPGGLGGGFGGGLGGGFM